VPTKLSCITLSCITLSCITLSCIGLSSSAEAATINTTLTMSNAPVSLGASGVTITGPVTLSIIGSGTITATAALSALSGSANVNAPFTITLSNGTDSISGAFQIPIGSLSGQSGTGSASISGGTGAYSGATGSFPALNFSATGTSPNLKVSASGSGTIVTGGPPAPTVTAVLDAASYTPTVAQGSIFVVKGTNMSPSGFVQTSYPLPPSSGGVSITFTPATGGAGTNAFLIYLYNQGGVNQLAAVAPSSLAMGSYNLTVTNNNGITSGAFSVTIVQRKAEIITADATGNGLAVLQNYVSATSLPVNRFTVGSVAGTAIAPAYPGQTEILWVVGMGAVPGGTDNSASPGYDFTQHGVKVQVIIGGTVTVTPAYAGRAPGLTGVDQINFTLPANVPTGCTVQIQISVNGAMSQLTNFMAIATDPSASSCIQPGYSTSQLRDFDNGATVTNGSFSMGQSARQGITGKTDSAFGAFYLYSGFELFSIPPGATTGVIQTGTCTVSQVNFSAVNGLVGGGGIALDAGKVTLSGPSGSNLSSTPFTETNNTYSLGIGVEGGTAIPGYGNGVLVAGSYALAGAGGMDVNAFNSSITIGPALVVTGGLPSTIVRANGLPLVWTGGNPSDTVSISGSSYQNSNGNLTGAGFICFTTAGAGGFTVPSSILTQLAAITAGQESSGAGSGSLSIGWGPAPVPFNPTRVTDGSAISSLFSASFGINEQAVYQ